MRTQHFFVHLPKCAGTSLLKSLGRIGKRRMVIVSTYPKSKRAALEGLNRQLADRRLTIDDPDLIFGHDVFYGIHQSSTRPVRYATVMRCPVQRWISQYRYFVDCSKNARSPIHDFSRSAVVEDDQILSLDQCAERGLWSNMLTHYLAGAVDPDLDTGRWHTRSTQRLKEMALDFIERMSFIGFVDTIAQDEATICEWFGLRSKLKVVNSSKTRVTENLSASTLTMIRQINAMDQDVYDHARHCQSRTVAE